MCGFCWHRNSSINLCCSRDNCPQTAARICSTQRVDYWCNNHSFIEWRLLVTYISKLEVKFIAIPCDLETRLNEIPTRIKIIKSGKCRFPKILGLRQFSTTPRRNCQQFISRKRLADNYADRWW